jgi:hypothetical protein
MLFPKILLLSKDNTFKRKAKQPLRGAFGSFLTDRAKMGPSTCDCGVSDEIPTAGAGGPSLSVNEMSLLKGTAFPFTVNVVFYGRAPGGYGFFKGPADDFVESFAFLEGK